MADPGAPKFIQKKFFLQYGDASLELIGLMSPHGITRIYSKDDSVAEIMSKISGKPFEIRIDSFDLNSIIEKQFAENGTFFEVRFINIPPEILAQLQLKVEKEGKAPGWSRLHPRISVTHVADLNSNVPNLCVVKHDNVEHYLNVLNFTIGGLRIESMADILETVEVGENLHFDLITTAGDSLFALKGEVRNIGVHKLQDKRSSEIRRSFGLKLHPMDRQNQQKYNEMIRLLCELLKKNPGSF